MQVCISDIRHLRTYDDMRNSATFYLACDTNFVALNGHMPIYCFLGISLVLNYIFSDEIEHLSKIYAVAHFNSGQQLVLVIKWFVGLLRINCPRKI